MLLFGPLKTSITRVLPRTGLQLLLDNHSLYFWVLNEHSRDLKGVMNLPSWRKTDGRQSTIDFDFAIMSVTYWPTGGWLTGWLTGQKKFLSVILSVTLLVTLSGVGRRSAFMKADSSCLIWTQDLRMWNQDLRIRTQDLRIWILPLS